MITEKTFKTALESIWYGFVAAMGLANQLSGMGATVNPATYDEPGFGKLVGIQAKAPMTILELLEIDTHAGGSKPGSILANEIDECLCDMYTEYPECLVADEVPEDCFCKILNTIRNAGITLPWERKDA